MKLSNIVKVEKVKAIPFDIMPDVTIELVYKSRAKTALVFKDSYVTEYDEEGTISQKLDLDKFCENFVRETIVGWSGMKLHHLTPYMFVDEGEDLEQEVEFSVENAIFLYKNCKQFEAWVAKVSQDIERFRN